MKCKEGYKKKDGKCVKESQGVTKVFRNVHNYSWIFILAGILVLGGVFWYGGTHDWFKGSNTYSIINEGDINNFLNNQEASPSSDCSLSLTPNSIFSGDRVTGTIRDGVNTHCYVIASNGEGWFIVYEGDTNANGVLTDTRNIDMVGEFTFRAICDVNHNGGMDTEDCLTNIKTLNVLERAGDCVDSDGENKDTPGHTTFGGDTFYDRCFDVGEALTEYICVDGISVSKNLACDLGETCIQTRSGGHCVTSGYDVGDVVGGGSDIGTITGDTGLSKEIDLSNVAVGGQCHLGARIHTEWTYANNKCSGIMGQQGLEWIFADSENVKWNAVDTSPQVHDVDKCPLVWDGVKNWKISAFPISSSLPECQLNYNYNVEVYVCEC